MKANVLSAGVIIVRNPPTPRFLMLRAFQYWDFPKGIVEPGEEPLQGALREVLEETGLSGLQFHWGYGYRETKPYGAGKVARYYLAESPEGEVYLPVNPELGRPEHEEFRWVTDCEARGLIGPRLRPILSWATWMMTRQRPPRGAC